MGEEEEVGEGEAQGTGLDDGCFGHFEFCLEGKRGNEGAGGKTGEKKTSNVPLFPSLCSSSFFPSLSSSLPASLFMDLIPKAFMIAARKPTK